MGQPGERPEAGRVINERTSSGSPVSTRQQPSDDTRATQQTVAGRATYSVGAAPPYHGPSNRGRTPPLLDLNQPDPTQEPVLPGAVPHAQQQSDPAIPEIATPTVVLSPVSATPLPSRYQPNPGRISPVLAQPPVAGAFRRPSTPRLITRYTVTELLVMSRMISPSEDAEQDEANRRVAENRAREQKSATCACDCLTQCFESFRNLFR